MAIPLDPNQESPKEAMAEAGADSMAWSYGDFEAEQDENGIDLSHIRANLKLTPRERIDKLDANLAQLYALRQGLPKRSGQ